MVAENGKKISNWFLNLKSPIIDLVVLWFDSPNYLIYNDYPLIYLFHTIFLITNLQIF